MRTAKNPNRNQLVIKVLAWNKCRVYIRKQSKNVSVRNTVPCSGQSAGRAVRILKIRQAKAPDQHHAVATCPGTGSSVPHHYQ